MDAERAERHLRLLAEAELRHVLATAADGAAQPAVRAIGRLGRVGGALVAAGAIDPVRVETIAAQFKTAIGVRGFQPPGLGLHLGRSQRFRSAPVAAVTSRVAAGPDGARMTVVPVGAMLPFRGEEAHGEVYFLSLISTGDTARIPAVVRVRRPPSGPVMTPVRGHLMPPQVLLATDDAGRPSNLIFSGGGHADAWQGHFNLHPAPARGARWLRVTSGDNAVQIDLTARPATSGLTAEPAPATPGERLIDALAESIIVGTALGVRLPAQPARPGDIVAALEAAGALSPFSPAPARLAALYQRLGIDSHGITVPPAADLPRPWTDVIAYYGRRHRPPARSGIAALPVLLPEIDGARFGLAGLHAQDGQTVLQLVATGLGQPHFQSGPAVYFGSSWWLRDDAGHWHVAVTHDWTSDGTGQACLGLRVYPPLGRTVTSLELDVTGATTRVRAHLPVCWWAAP